MSTVTISTHNGKSIAWKHNWREEEFIKKELEREYEKYLEKYENEIKRGEKIPEFVPHIDTTKSYLNENYVPEENKNLTLEKFYKQEFNQALTEYNYKQIEKGHPERVIKDYLKKVKKDKNLIPAREMIVGIYNQTQNEEISIEKQKEIIKQFVDNWHEKYPNIKIIGCYIHCDERGNGIHAHIDYVPVCESKRGLSHQVSMKGALRQLGIENKTGKRADNPLSLFTKEVNKDLERICSLHNIDVIHPQRDGEKVEHLEKELYIATQKVNDLQNEIISLNETIEQQQQKINFFRSKINEIKPKVNEIIESFKNWQSLTEPLRTQIKRAIDKGKEIKNEINILNSIFNDIKTGPKLTEKERVERTINKGLPPEKLQTHSAFKMPEPSKEFNKKINKK